MLLRIGWIVLLAAGLCRADEAALQNPQRTRAVAELEGRIEAVDVQNRTLKVKDDQGRAWSIAVDHDTPISNTQNAQLALADLKENDAVRIYYTTFNMTARQIDQIVRGNLLWAL